jgi:DNA polymerase III delta prime subunit
MLFQTKNGNPQHFLLHGERGIGKSSLLYIQELTAAGDIVGWDEQRFNFLTVTAILEPGDNYETIVRKLGAALRRRLSSHAATKDYVRATWDFLKCWEILGVRYHASEHTIASSELLDELAHSYGTACARTAETFDGILLLIDEADKPTSDAQLGALLKGLTERITRMEHARVCLGVAGVSGIIETLRRSHESSPRIFTSFHLQPLSREESVQVVRKGLREAAEKNQKETTVTDDAVTLIAMLSEGYPHFIQQFAFSAFEADEDWNIDRNDVLRGAWAEHGAFQQLGTKYFENLYFDRISSDDYRQVLRAMSDHLDGWVSKEELRAKCPQLKSSTLNNALKALSSRRIIIPQHGVRGSYRLPTKSFATWIKGFTSSGSDTLHASQQG